MLSNRTVDQGAQRNGLLFHGTPPSLIGVGTMTTKRVLPLSLALGPQRHADPRVGWSSSFLCSKSNTKFFSKRQNNSYSANITYKNLGFRFLVACMKDQIMLLIGKPLQLSTFFFSFLPAAFRTEMRAEHRTGRAPSMTGRSFYNLCHCSAEKKTITEQT